MRSPYPFFFNYAQNRKKKYISFVTTRLDLLKDKSGCVGGTSHRQPQSRKFSGALPREPPTANKTIFYHCIVNRKRSLVIFCKFKRIHSSGAIYWHNDKHDA